MESKLVHPSYFRVKVVCSMHQKTDTINGSVQLQVALETFSSSYIQVIHRMNERSEPPLQGSSDCFAKSSDPEPYRIPAGGKSSPFYAGRKVQYVFALT